MFDYSSLFETKEKTNEEQLQAICDKYESDIDAGDFKWFAFEVAVKCGAVALKKSGERLDCDLIATKFLIMLKGFVIMRLKITSILLSLIFSKMSSILAREHLRTAKTFQK